MAKKRIHEIAKERGLSSKEVLQKLQAAGLEVKAPASSIEESEAARILDGDGAAPAKPAAAAAAKPAERGAPVRPPEGRGQPVRPPEGRGQPVRADAAKPAERGAPVRPPEGRGQPVRPPEGRGQPVRPPAGRGQPVRPPEGRGQPVRPGESRPAAPRPAEGAGSPRPVRPVRRPSLDDLPVDPRRQMGRSGPGQARPTRIAVPPQAPPQPAAKPKPAAEEKPAKAEAQAAEKQAEKTEAKKPVLQPHTEPPKPGTGPRIIAVPEPPKRPKRDETQTQPSGRATGRRVEGGPGGRRRVVIDSQAARRGPGGPATGPQRQQRRRRRRRRTTVEDVPQAVVEDQLTRTDVIKINSGSTVKDVAEYLGVPVPEVIKKLMSMGELATLTKTLSDDHIEILADEFGKKIEIVHIGEEDAEPEFDDAEEDLVERPPVVTVMGHVDHGKTSLLDAIRKSDVASQEAGGITQHIGAYQVHHNGKTITFLDTPGHEAFTAMRARGARVTDIAVIVVAADDGVQPQTDEAIDHARAADVPIIIAVNKIDKEGADPVRVRTELTQRNLQPAEWGGDTEFVDVSAKRGDGLEDLLETILVVAELEELQANPNAEASGVVIESKLDPGRGPVVTLLVQRGTLRVGDAIVAGTSPGRVRAMMNYRGERIEEARPGDPVEILGFDSVPDAGEFARVVANDREARRLAQERETREKAEALARRSGRKMSFEDVFARAREHQATELPLIIKADVAGSVGALEDEIARLPQDEVIVNVIHSGVGGITESDVMLASASNAVILGFNVRPVGAAREAADREGVEIRLYSVIYQALDDLKAAMQGLLAPEEVEEQLGTVEVRKIFRASKVGTIAGSYVTEGVVRRGAKVRVIRDGMVIHDTTIDTLRRFQDDVREVAAGYECGIVLAGVQDIQEGDTFEVYETRQVERALQPS